MILLLTGGEADVRHLVPEGGDLATLRCLGAHLVTHSIVDVVARRVWEALLACWQESFQLEGRGEAIRRALAPAIDKMKPLEWHLPEEAEKHGRRKTPVAVLAEVAV